MGCCTNFRHFCETVGAGDFLRTEKTLNFIGPDGKNNAFSASWLPAPLHLFPAFRRLSYLSKPAVRELSQGLKALAKLSPTDPITQPFSRWLEEHRQSPEVIELFWHVVLVSALSETLDRIDTRQARKVFFDGFLANRHGWEVQIPTVPLDELYGKPLQTWLTEHGVNLRLKTGAERLVMAEEKVSHLTPRDGKTLSADHFVLAVPHYRMAALLPEEITNHPQLAGAGELESAPISSVHLWFDRPITDLPHAVLIGRLSQWMFNRTRLQSQSSEGESHYYQVVISASRELQHLSQEAIIQEVRHELCEIWPRVNVAELLNARVVTEHRAVFSVMAGSDALRTSQQSPIDNLQIAGDWTNTGWPGTMESAVRSGYLAAENILAKLGRAERVLQPDLPVSWLTRLLLGNRWET